MINVTKTYLPPLDEFLPYLERIWATHQVTNYGPLVQELEEKLRAYLGVRHIYFVSNGTIALQLAIRALDLHGEILTTPFSYVATTSSIVWEGCTPVFVDIHPQTLTLDPDLIEAAITPRTSAILPTHVYGFPCDVERIQQVADAHGLKVIYDAAHAFGVKYKGQPLVNFGDISTLSFHATKLFHTGEGGALVTNNANLANRIQTLMNFGHLDKEKFAGVGINGKNSEVHAAMGLCILPRIHELIERRRELSQEYDRGLQGTDITKPCPLPATEHNFAYYAVLFPSEQRLVQAQQALNEHGIMPRRYLYPALNSLNYVSHRPMPVAEDMAGKVLCLPLSHYLEVEDVRRITRILREGQ